MGCGSSPEGRNTKYRGRLTTASRPTVADSPRVAMAHRSARISEIQRSQDAQTGSSWPTLSRAAATSWRTESTSPSSAAP